MSSIPTDLGRRCIVLLLAATMPLCCCIVKSMAASPADPNATAIVSCCCDSSKCDSDKQSTPSSEPDGCANACCFKAPPSIDQWMPPVDAIGAAIDWPVIIATPSVVAAEKVVRRQAKGPPPGPWGASAPPLRHATILQV
ncbi:MAG: hypothetical protein GY876_10305 [Planctomycetes bacterium]|nr:hypothetical protein [Planctomycetota bacterium]